MPVGDIYNLQLLSLSNTTYWLNNYFYRVMSDPTNIINAVQVENVVGRALQIRQCYGMGLAAHCLGYKAWVIGTSEPYYLHGVSLRGLGGLNIMPAKVCESHTLYPSDRSFPRGFKHISGLPADSYSSGELLGNVGFFRFFYKLVLDDHFFLPVADLAPVIYSRPSAVYPSGRWSVVRFAVPRGLSSQGTRDGKANPSLKTSFGI